MSKILPIVTVIVPTTPDREGFNQRVLDCFKRQDYPNKEIAFDYDSGNVGEKRNRLCSKAMGDILLHMDSDDLFKTNWISYSVDALINSEADIAGLSRVRFYDMRDKAWYLYSFPHNQLNTWVAGGSMVYWKNFWRNNPFRETNIGEDNQFLLGVKEKPKVYAHEYVDGFVASIHNNNTSSKALYNARYTRCSEEDEVLLREHWKYFDIDLKP